MTLYDDDIVGCENLAPQGYFVSDVGTAPAGVRLIFLQGLGSRLPVFWGDFVDHIGFP
jgi:hypothetical protein